MIDAREQGQENWIMKTIQLQALSMIKVHCIDWSYTILKAAIIKYFGFT